jgi:hypothetical protein
MGDLPPGVAERRGYPRKRSTAMALIRYGSNRGLPCSLLDVSGGGARLMSPMASLPPKFKLWMFGKPGVVRDCEVVWQSGLQFGIKFERGPRI